MHPIAAFAGLGTCGLWDLSQLPIFHIFILLSLSGPSSSRIRGVRRLRLGNFLKYGDTAEWRNTGKHIGRMLNPLIPG